LDAAGLRNRAENMLGAERVAALEQGSGILGVLKKDGIGGIWQMMKDKFGDIKEQVMDKIREMVSIEVIKAGVIWLLSLMNPAAGLFRLLKMMVNAATFFITQGSQIKEMVLAFFASVKAVASGNVAKIAESIKEALIRSIPVLIGLLASIIGVGGIAKKAMKIISGAGRKIKDFFKNMFRRMRGKGGKRRKKRQTDGRGVPKRKEDRRSNPKNPLADGDLGSVEKLDGHTLWLKKKGKRYVMMSASIPQPLKDRISNWETSLTDKINKTTDTEKLKDLKLLKTKLNNLKTVMNATNKEIRLSKYLISKYNTKHDAASLKMLKRKINAKDKLIEGKQSWIMKRLRLFYKYDSEKLTSKDKFHDFVLATTIPKAPEAAHREIISASSEHQRKMERGTGVYKAEGVRKKLRETGIIKALFKTMFSGVRPFSLFMYKLVNEILRKEKETTPSLDIGEKFKKLKKKYSQTDTRTVKEVKKYFFNKAKHSTVVKGITDDLRGRDSEAEERLREPDVTELIKDAAQDANSTYGPNGWAAVFAVPGRSIRVVEDNIVGNVARKKGDILKFLDALPTSKFEPQLRKSFNDLLKQIPSQQLQTYLQNNGYANKGALRARFDQFLQTMINNLQGKELHFVPWTGIPRDLTIGNRNYIKGNTSLKNKKYRETFKNAPKAIAGNLQKVIKDNQIHHNLPLYLGGGSEFTALTLVTGKAWDKNTIHGKLHKMINKEDIAAKLGYDKSSKISVTLDRASLLKHYNRDRLVILVGSVLLDGQIIYKESIHIPKYGVNASKSNRNSNLKFRPKN